MSRLKRQQQRKSDERFAERFAQQWTAMRATRVEEPVSIHAGKSNYSAARVPYGVDLAAQWSWRLLVVALAGLVLARGIGMFAVVVLPLVFALLLAALLVPLVQVLHRARVPRGVASLLAVLGSIAIIVLLLTFAGQQIAQGANDLAKQVVSGPVSYTHLTLPTN